MRTETHNTPLLGRDGIDSHIDGPSSDDSSNRCTILTHKGEPGRDPQWTVENKIVTPPVAANDHLPEITVSTRRPRLTTLTRIGVESACARAVLASLFCVCVFVWVCCNPTGRRVAWGRRRGAAGAFPVYFVGLNYAAIQFRAYSSFSYRLS